MSELIALLQQHPDQQRQIVLRDTDTALTRAQLIEQVRELAARLKARRIRRLALHADNSVAWVLADLACQVAGIVCVPLPLFFTRMQVLHALHSCGTDAVLTLAPAGFAPHFATTEPVPGLPYTLLLQPHARTPLIPEGTGKVTFTSGSTGTPHGVCLSNAQLLLQAQALATAVGLAAPLHLCVLPLSTLLENIAGVYAPLLAGGTVELKSMAELGFSGSRLGNAGKFLSAINSVAPHTLILIPQLLQLLVHAARGGWRAPGLRFVAVGGSRVAASLVDAARALGLPIFEGYGLSECASVVSLNTTAGDQPGSCGKVLPHLSVSIEDGEIHVSGNSMLGYVDQPASWYRKRLPTGDLGYLDAAGYLHIDGRRRNVLISSYGRNVAPEWVESELLASPLLSEAVVLGDARPNCVALLTPVRATLTNAELEHAVAAANARLPDYAQVRHWLRLTQPLAANPALMTPTGKLRRERIAQVFAGQIDALYSDAGTPADDPESCHAEATS